MVRNRVVIKYLGYILLFNALFLFIAALISLYQRESSLNALLFSATMCAALGTFLASCDGSAAGVPGMTRW